MKLRIALAAASIATCAMFATAAQANPVYIGYQINSAGPITQVATGNGHTTFTGIVGGQWSVDAAVTGTSTPSTIFDLPEPNMTSSNTSISTGVSGNISIYVSQTGLTQRQFASILSAFTNLGSSDPTVIVTELSYLQLCTGALNTCSAADTFATTNLLASETVTPNHAVSDMYSVAANFPAFYTDPTALYSETVVYNFTFGTGVTNSVNATVGLSAVPEPLTLSLFGAGLVGAAAMRRRKKAA